MDGVHDAQRLKELQALPLERKIMITQTRIMEWYQKFNGNVYVSFSGGKDSTVLLHIARKLFPDIPAVFSNTGLEYYQIQRFAKQHDNVTFIAPKIRFDQVVSQFGYPLISKEVAEAIYYARRINSQSVQVERERAEPKSGESAANCLAQGESAPYPDGNSAEPQNSLARPLGRSRPQAGRTSGRLAEAESIPTNHARRVRQSRGKWENYHRRSLHPDESNPADKECFWNKRKQTDWSNWRRGCL